VTGDYEYIENSPIGYNHFRSVKWIFNDEEIPVQDIYEKVLSQQTIYKLNSAWLKREFFVSGKRKDVTEELKNYVLVIDEINRGNISQILGELITLLEKDKRKGKEESTTVVLPYSREPFTIPPNLFIIGTMNTADRSIEAIDTALRRRFSFIEIAPDSNIIGEKGYSKNANGIVEDIDLVELLETINERVEKLLDKDHKIGHSYFMKVKSHSDLVKAFKNKVIPLLEEYFYGDYGKIGLVLGKEFITIKDGNTDGFSFANFSHYDQDVINDLKERKVYQITDTEDWSIESFQSIYSSSSE
jgi:5-methylcytosine-specific restriction endonuclease McrBC GTP-binding regulatory subunit McrB